MILYEQLSDTLIRVRMEPNIYVQSTSFSYSKEEGFKEDESDKFILLNYFIPDADMDVYLELTKGNPDAFEETRIYKIPSEKWVYCKKGKKIEQCFSFDSLELKRKNGAISFYTRKTQKKIKQLDDDGTLFLVNRDDDDNNNNNNDKNEKLMSIELLKEQKLNKLKAKINGQGYEFSSMLTNTFKIGMTVDNNKPTTLLEPIIIQKETISFREPRILKYQQKKIDGSSQISQSQILNSQNNKENHDHEDIILLQEEMKPLINKIQLMISIQDSQQQQLSTQDKSLIYQELLKLSLNKVKLICDTIDFSSLSEEDLCDLFNSFLNEKNLNHSVGSTIIQSSLYPLVIQLSNSLSRILMNSVLDLGKQYGNIIMDGLILPILNEVQTNKTEFSRPQLELITKLINNSFSIPTRITLLNYLAYEYHHKILSDKNLSNHIIQFINTIVNSQPPITLNEMMIRQLLQISQSIIEMQPKEKGCMQLLLTLVNKHAQSIVETNTLDDLENVTKQSQMFLKKSILGQINSLRLKSQK
ncbi:unnamed protein product [Cunninghamella blakesleeana]